MRWLLPLIVVALAGCADPAETADVDEATSYFDSGLLGPGERFSFTFEEVNEAGYTYHCHPHPWMDGMVHVGEDTDGTTTTHEVQIVETGGSDSWGYVEQHLYIEVGDTVTWINTGAADHTATEAAADHDHGHHDH